jgi:hypothetical protein
MFEFLAKKKVHHTTLWALFLEMGFLSDTVIRSKNDNLAYNIMGGDAGLHLKGAAGCLGKYHRTMKECKFRGN